MNKLLDKISTLETKELAKMLFRQKDDFIESVLDGVREELQRRDFKPEQIIEEIGYQFNNENIINCTLEEALLKLDSDLSNWDVLSFKNYFNEQLSLQKTLSFWVLYYYDNVKNFSVGINHTVDAKSVLEKFLKLEDWKPAEDDRYYFEDWEIFQASNSSVYIEKLSQRLKEKEIPFLMQNMNAWHLNQIYGPNTSTEPFLILVPLNELEKCEEVLTGIQNEAEILNQELAEAEQSSDCIKQLEIYDKLEEIQLCDSIMYFNKGCVLIELNQLNEAAEAFIESITIASKDGDKNSVDETLKVLEDMLEELPENINILHTLASIAVERNEEKNAVKYYEKIVSIKDKDSYAHLQLGYLYFASGGKSDSARTHFNKYLELEPDAQDRDEIKDILSQLKPIYQ